MRIKKSIKSAVYNIIEKTYAKYYVYLHNKNVDQNQAVHIP